MVLLQPTLGLTDLPDDEAAEIVSAYESGILELAQRAPARIVPLAAGSTRMDSSARPSAHPS